MCACEEKDPSRGFAQEDDCSVQQPSGALCRKWEHNMRKRARNKEEEDERYGFCSEGVAAGAGAAAGVAAGAAAGAAGAAAG